MATTIRRMAVRDTALTPLTEETIVAVALAMLRPDVTFAGAYLDQWAMVIAAIVTVWSGADYLARSSAALRT